MAALGTTLGSSNNASNMAANRGVSRLGMMQAKLQEQLLVEKESRLLEMAARQEAERDYTIQRVTRSSASSLSSSLSSLSLGSSLSGGQGRVRKMFEDRRSTGYDKSYPLNPVKGGGSGGGGRTAAGGAKPPVRGVVKSNGGGGRAISTERGAPGGGYGQQPRSRSQVAPKQRAAPAGSKTGTSVVSRQNRINNNGSNNSNSRPGHHKSNPSLLDADNGGLDSNSNNRSSLGVGRTPPSPLPPSSSSSTPTPRSAPPPRRAPPPKSKPSPAPSPRPAALKQRNSTTKAPPSLAPSPLPRRGSTASNVSAAPREVPPGMEQCPVCERCFNSDRIEKHRTICEKSKAKAKKRKVFDPVKMRNKGTEAEKYVARGAHLKEPKKPKKKDWRKQHEDFIATVRAAKGMQGYEAPPLDTSDYTQCPHCGRKFNQMAAERHIPKCSDIKSNKPVGQRR